MSLEIKLQMEHRMPVIHRVRVDFNIPGHSYSTTKTKREENPPTKYIITVLSVKCGYPDMKFCFFLNIGEFYGFDFLPPGSQSFPKFKNIRTINQSMLYSIYLITVITFTRLDSITLLSASHLLHLLQAIKRWIILYCRAYNLVERSTI